METKVGEKSDLLLGGDDRLDILDNGLNKYFLNPLEFEGLINRGSCTCNPLNEYSNKVFQTLQARREHESFKQIQDQQVLRLKKLLNYEGQDKFDIIFAPSGSDLVYLPVLFSTLLHPNKKITNFLTCPEELGSGSQIAANGQYFMNMNQFGEGVQKMANVPGNLNIEVAYFNARSQSGHILDHKETLKREISLYPNDAKIGSLVIGSKSGIADNLSVIDEVEDELLWTIDLCQFRNSKKLVNDLLDKGCTLMITGSKFYQAPPFCGAMLVPKQLINRLKKCSFNDQSKFIYNIFSANDFPDSLANIKEQLRQFENTGLQSRWEVAISEMEQLNQIPNETINKVISDWNTAVMNRLASHDCFKLMPNQKISNQTIISFRVKQNNSFLSYDELRELFELVLTNNYHISEKFNRVSMGQPVRYMDKSFIRLALGSYNLRKLLQKPEESRFDNDIKIVDLIASLVEAN